jgi:hypothetical protein
MMNLILSALLLAWTACSFKKTPLDNMVTEGHQELYSMPQDVPLEKLEEKVRRVVIVATNDIQGQYQPRDVKITDRHSPQGQHITIGGVDIISSYFKLMRERYQNVVLVDSGNILPSEPAKIKPVQNFYSYLRYDGITLGLGDFNLKLPQQHTASANFFQDFARKASPPLLISNLFDLKTARLVEWQGSKPYVLKEMNGVKVGIIGLIPDDIVKLTPVDNRVGLYVENMLQSTLRNARLLRSLGADLVVVITHQGMECGKAQAQQKKLMLEKVNFEPLKENVCDLSSGLGEYLQRLPPQLVDVVIGGRHQQKMANLINDIVVLSSFGEGSAFSFAELFVHTKDKTVLRDKTIIHQPVMLCREFFKETNDCFGQDPSVDHRQRIPATFMGKPVLPDPEAEKQFPELKEIKTAQTHSMQREIHQALEISQSDIFYQHRSSTGNSQLLSIKLSGQELAQLLEQEFNEGSTEGWIPAPFELTQTGLLLKINGQLLEREKTYFILADLEGLQNRPTLRRLILSNNTRALMNHSWNSLLTESDVVNTSMAAQQH